MGQPYPRSYDGIPLSDLTPEHGHALQTTIARVLEIEIARTTFAQILDGLPLDNGRQPRPWLHPPVDGKHDVCRGAYDALAAFQNNFSLDMLHFDTKKAQAYQNSSLGSEEFRKHLLEMTAVALHNIGADLFNQADGGLHQVRFEPKSLLGEPTKEQVEEPLEEPTEQWTEIKRPTRPLFYHADYLHWSQYPQGIADCVGYWTENRILGGVVIFDRGESGLEYNDLYIHPIPPARLFAILPRQLQAFAKLGTNVQQEEGKPPLLPLKPQRGAKRLMEWETHRLHILRDEWERLPPRADWRGPVNRWTLDDDVDWLYGLHEAVESGMLPNDTALPPLPPPQG